MKRAVLVLGFLILTMSVANAQTYVFKTSDDAITIDGNLTDWINATVLAWRSPHSDVDLNYIYFLHSDGYYFIGAKIYDNDNKEDDYLKLYFNDSSTIYRFDLEEGLDVVDTYKYVNGNWTPIAVNTTVVYTSSSLQPYTYVELKLPKSTLNNSSTLLFYLEYVSTHIRNVYGWYPSNGNFSNFSTWKVLNFIEIVNRTLNLSISDRDGVPIDYADDDLLVEIKYTLNNTHIVTLLGRPKMNILVPPANITVLIKYLSVPVFEKTYDLSLTNISDSISINNLLKVYTPLGYFIISVEKNGTLKGVDFDYAKGRAIILTQSKEIFFDSKTPWRFLGVLYANNYEYNPATGHLLVRLNSTQDTGLVLVTGDASHPVLAYANNTVRSILYDHEKKVYSLYVTSGTYKFYSAEKPFAVAFNGSALKIGKDYSVDEFNITTISVPTEGFLDVYYSNPTSVSVEKSEGLKIYIATPYDFSGKIRYVVKSHEQTVEDKTVLFRAEAPLTTVTISPSVSGDVEITVYDSDSNQVLYSTTVQQFYLDYMKILIALALVIALIAIILAISKAGKEKARAKIEENWRFFRRL